MALLLQRCCGSCVRTTLLFGDRREGPPTGLLPVFRRRLITGVGSASLVAVGANFAGITSFLLGLSPDIGRRLKLDVLYPVDGYSRCLDANQGFVLASCHLLDGHRPKVAALEKNGPFLSESEYTTEVQYSILKALFFNEFIYPANWVGDQTLLYRAAGKAELERSLDPPPLNDKRSFRRLQNVNEPVVAFGPPGSKGELNVSVIVSPVPLDFSIEAFGGPKEVGEALMRSVAGGSRRTDINAILIDSTMRTDPLQDVNYYMLEFRVDSPSFHRHNVAVCTARRGRLFTLNAQAPESAWPDIREEFYKMSNSFSLVSSS